MLVGTRLVTKGLDIAAVALVGIVSADIALNLPDERSAERTYQLLRQAIGRAGRGARPGRAIIQTYVPDHPAIRAVADGDSETFYRDELAARRRFGAPPFGRYIKLTVALEDRAAAEAAGRTMAGETADAGAGGRAATRSSWGRFRPISPDEAAAGGSISSSGARIRAPSCAPTLDHRGASTSTPRASSRLAGRGRPTAPFILRP